MSKDEVCFHYNYQRILRLYGFEEPEHALTYPCHGFISYTPDPVAQTTATTESSVSVTSDADAASPTSNGTTPTTAGETPVSTELSTNAENIVTELTQTSQTIMLFNTTTLPSLTNATLEEVQKLNANITSKESSTDAVTTDTTISRTAETATFSQQISNSPNEPLTSTISVATTLSSTQPSVDIPEKLNEPAPTTEITEMSQKNEVTIPFQDKTVEPSGSETVLVPISAPSDTFKDFTLSESAPNSTLIELPNRFNKSRSLKHRPPTISKASEEILKNEMKKILDKYKNRNFTNINDIINEIEREFKFNSSENSSSFPDDLLADLLANNKNWNSSENSISASLSGEFNNLGDFFNDSFTSLESALSSKEYFKDLLNATKFKLFNDTLKKYHGFGFSNETLNFTHGKFDHDISLEFTPFNHSFSPFFNSSEENSKDLSSFYGTVVGFFENATQSFKDYFSGFSTSTPAPSGVLDIDLITTTSIPQADSNVTDKSTHKLSVNTSTVPTLVSQNNFNKSSAELGGENTNHILPKKSISGKNDYVAVASQNSPNYVNILSLRESKLTETKFDIKGSHRPKKVSKRSNNAISVEDLLYPSKRVDAANFASNLISNATNSLLRDKIINITQTDSTELGVRKVRSTNGAFKTN